MRKNVFWASLSALALFLVMTSVYLVSVLQHRFGGYDLSPLIDSGWRVLSGQRPNRDFICTFPPVLYMGAAAAFKIFGVRWMALSLISVCYTLTLTLLGVRVLLLLRDLMTDAAILGLSVTFAVLEFLPVLLVGHPWHSSWTEDAVLYAFLAAFALGKSSSSNGRFRRELLLHLGLAECLLLFSKPNTALPTLIVCVFALLLRPQRMRNVAYPLAGGLGLSCILFFLVGASLLSTYRIYFQLSSRLTEDSRFEELFSNPFITGGLPDLAVYLAVLPAVVWVLIFGVRALRAREVRWVGVLALGGLIVSFLGLGTNVEFHLVDMPCLLLGAALLGVTLPLKNRLFLGGALAQSLFFLFLIGIFHAETRSRMQAVGVWGKEGCGAQVKRKDRFFGTFFGCSGFFSVLSETDAALEQHPTQRVFFGPRMEFLYARDGIRSPLGLPLWWHPGSSFPVRDTAAVVQAWQTDHFDLLFFPHNDRTRVPQKILDDIAENYRELPAAVDADKDPEAHVDVFLRR